jgi:hypothetical protein
MGFFGKNKKQDARDGDRNRSTAQGVNLYLYLSDTEWRAQFVAPDGIVTGDPIGEEFIVAKNKGASFAESGEIVQRALKQVTERQGSNIGTVSIVLNDPGISLLDNLDSHFSSANVAKIRQFGMECLHCDEVTYGFSRFGPGEITGMATGRADQGVFGFADIQVLRRYLGQLDKLAVKTVLITPVAQNTIFDAASHPDRTLCGIYVGGRSTLVVAGNAAHGSVTTRKLPVGLYTLVDAVAAANNVAISDALTALSRRDCLSQVLLDPGAVGQADNPVPGQFERILGDTVRALGDEIDRTLQFFDVQRMGGRPETIKIYGPVAGVKGLGTWLGNRLGAEIIDANGSILTDLIHRPRTDGLNLLEGAKSPLITLGRVNYAWDKDRFLPEQEMDADEVAEEKAAAGIIAGKSTGKSAGKPETGSDRSRLTKRFRQGKTKPENTPSGRSRRRRPPPVEIQKSERAGYVLLALFAFVFLYGGYNTFIKPKINQFDQITYTYTGTIQKNVSLRSKTIRKMEDNPVKRLVDRERHKVLWTEKFLALGCYASRAVWLTDVFLTTATTTASGKLENIQKLTIKGAILPSSDGHLLQISDYIRRLEEDKRGLFMGDFKRITFEGATVDYEDVEEIIRFTIEGWYDKNKPKPARQLFVHGDLSMAGCQAPDSAESTPRKEALLEPPVPGDSPRLKR